MQRIECVELNVAAVVLWKCVLVLERRKLAAGAAHRLLTGDVRTCSTHLKYLVLFLDLLVSVLLNELQAS